MQGPGTFLDVATYPPGAGVNDARIVIDGDRGAIFVYGSGTSGPGGTGPLLGSWAGAAGTDPYGNTYGQGLTIDVGAITGITLKIGGNSYFQVDQSGDAVFHSATGDEHWLYPNIVNPSGPSEEYYLGSSLSASVALNNYTHVSGLSVLSGFTSYFLNGTTWYAFQVSQGQITIYTATTQNGPWTSQSTISLYDGSNVGGLTFSAPSIRISAANNSSLEVVNGVNQWQFEELLAYTAADQPINTQTNLTQDVYLSYSTLQPSAIYQVDGLFLFTGPTSTDFKWSYAIGGTGDYFIARHDYLATGGSQVISNDIYTASATNVHASLTDGTTFATNGHSVLLHGTYLTAGAGGTPGVFGLMWAQNTSNAGNLNLRKGSYLNLRRIA